MIDYGQVIITSVIGGAVAGGFAGFGAYVAIRVQVALLTLRADRADDDRKDMKISIDDAHERIDMWTRSRTKTI
jgi:hypothetical protein